MELNGENSIENLILIPEELKENVLCSLCHQILINPYQCDECENCFCYDCINIIYANEKECPKCNKTLNISKSETMEKFLSLFKYKCINNCGEELEYKDLINHLTKCSKIKIEDRSKDILSEIEKVKKELEEIDKIYENKMMKLRPEKNKWGGTDYTDLDFRKFYISMTHPHPLVHAPERSTTCSCDICRNNVVKEQGDYAYACIVCDYDICPRCWKKEMEHLNEHW